jgi:hypothetical protein
MDGSRHRVPMKGGGGDVASLKTPATEQTARLYAGSSPAVRLAYSHGMRASLFGRTGITERST